MFDDTGDEMKSQAWTALVLDTKRGTRRPDPRQMSAPKFHAGHA